MPVHRDWILTPERAAVHRPTGTMVAADLHLGYAAARRRGGEAVPEPSLHEILRPLEELALRENARCLVIAGDLFEAGRKEELVQGLLAWLAAAKVELVAVVPGNHDRRLTAADELLPVAPEGWRLGDWQIVHGDGPLPAGPTMQGHEHPCLDWRGVTAPCYLVGGQHIILPAFSRDARGVNVLNQRRWMTYRCGVIVDQEVLDLGDVERIKKAAGGLAGHR